MNLPVADAQKPGLAGQLVRRIRVGRIDRQDTSDGLAGNGKLPWFLLFPINLGIGTKVNASNPKVGTVFQRVLFDQGLLQSDLQLR